MMCAARFGGVGVAQGVDLWPSELTMTMLNGQLGDIYGGQGLRGRLASRATTFFLFDGGRSHGAAARQEAIPRPARAPPGWRCVASYAVGVRAVCCGEQLRGGRVSQVARDGLTPPRARKATRYVGRPRCAWLATRPAR